MLSFQSSCMTRTERHHRMHSSIIKMESCIGNRAQLRYWGQFMRFWSCYKTTSNGNIFTFLLSCINVKRKSSRIHLLNTHSVRHLPFASHSSIAFPLFTFGKMCWVDEMRKKCYHLNLSSCSLHKQVPRYYGHIVGIWRSITKFGGGFTYLSMRDTVEMNKRFK